MSWCGALSKSRPESIMQKMQWQQGMCLLFQQIVLLIVLERKIIAGRSVISRERSFRETCMAEPVVQLAPSHTREQWRMQFISQALHFRLAIALHRLPPVVSAGRPRHCASHQTSQIVPCTATNGPDVLSSNERTRHRGYPPY